MSEPLRVLIIPVAGVASRFSKSLGREVLKGIYFERSPEDAVLHRLISMGYSLGFQKIVVVGGFHFDELKLFLATHFPSIPGLSLVENLQYKSTGTLYSFYMGLKEIFETGDYQEVVLAEGDLTFDRASFKRVIQSNKNVVTTCPEPITAERSVAFYITNTSELRFVYDVNHKVLHIPVSFRAIYNSGQVWKFCDMELLKSLFSELPPLLFIDTNLGFIEDYFSMLPSEAIEVIPFKEWQNCNTVEDFRSTITVKSGRC